MIEYNRKAAREDMNLALDHLLADRAALDAHLDASSEDRLFWNNMQQVDRLLGSEPIMRAPMDFSSQIMGAIAAGQQPDPKWERADLRTALGLLVVALVLSPVAIGVMFYAQRLMSDPAGLALLLRQFVTLLNTLLAAFDSALANVAHQIIFVEIVAAAALITLPSAIMVMMVRYFNQMRREPQIVYRIPVVAM